MIWTTQVAGSGREKAGDVDRRSRTGAVGVRRMSKGGANAWLKELLMVDGRHGAAAFGAYVFGVVLFIWDFALVADDSPVWLRPGWTIIGLVVPAVLVTRVFCTDFSHGTVERLLVSPVGRQSIWFARVGLSGLMLFVPLIVGWALVSMSGFYEQGSVGGHAHFIERYSYLSFGMLVAWCAWCFGPLATVLLRRAILVFSVTLISPFGVVVLLALISGLTGFNQGMVSMLETFPYVALALLGLAFVVGVISQFVAALVWRRMEVR